MISVGSRDGRKGLRLGYDGGAEMEETELEEGETCSYQYNDDSTIDPDVALSYIDEKLHDVLGHFQKDFEGGVSAENLGAKFGGYGSFLPAYQRPPVWSRPKTPLKVHNCNTPRSPNNLHLEVDIYAKHGQASATAASLPLVRASVNDSAKTDVGVSFAHCTEESTSRCELGKSYDQPSDQKTLKVCIKVGSDNLLTQKNAELYSGLGLDNSPASSLEDSPTDSGGLPHEHQDAPDESPTSIIQIMTSFPVHGNLLLSPLPDDLAYLTEKEKLKGESKPRFLLKGGQESSNGSDSARGEDKVLGGKKSKSFEKKNLNDKDIQNGIGEKETDIDTLACEELVANALKLPLLSNSYSNVDNSAKGTAKAVDNFRVANKVKEGSFSNLAEGNTLEAVSTQEIGLVEKPSGNIASADKLWEDKKADFHNDISDKKELMFLPKLTQMFVRGEKLKMLNSVILWSRRLVRNLHLMKKMICNASGKEHSSSGGKKKSKGSRSHSAQGAEVPKDSSRMDSSLVPKNKKSMHANNYLSKSEIEDSKLQKDNGKARNRYRDFFGDIELEDGDNHGDSAEMLSIDKPKTFESVERSTFASNRTLKERLNGKKMDKPSTSEAYSKEALNAAPITGNGSISDAAPGTLDPLANDNWVCCDKCQKWRLLPLGTNPESLPEKWLCSMLNWLPGMNRCSISEEETTKALMPLYQVPAPDKQINQHCHRAGVLPGLSMTDDSRFDQNHRSLGFHAVPKGGKKKNRIKEVLAATSQDGPPQLFNSMKKNLQAAVKSRSLNGVNQSPVANEIEPMYLNKSSVVEKHRHKQKEKNKLLERHSDGGETSSSKIKSKWDTDQDCFRISKKIKLDGMRFTDEDWMHDNDGPVGKVGPSSSSGFSVNASQNDQHKDDYHSLKDRKCEADNGSKVPPRSPKGQFQVTSDDGSPYMEKIDDKGVTRKRKMEHTSENIHRKEMKASVSKSEGKETSTSKGSDGTMKKGRSTKEQQMGPNLGGTLSQRSLDAMDSLRRDLGSVQPTQAANSSSSKVSGSHKNKTNMHEVKGSPVESVSSSPLRFSNSYKSTSRRSFEGKDVFGDAGLFATGTPRRCSNKDDRMSNRSGTVKKDEIFVTHCGSMKPAVLDFQERDIGHLAGREAKIQFVHSPEFANCHFANGSTDTFGNDTEHPGKPHTSDQHCDEERGNDMQYHANVSHPKKSGKGSSSWSKEKNGSSKSELDKGKVKISESIDHTPYEEKSGARKNKVQEKLGVNSDKVEKNFMGKKESAGEVAGENRESESQSKFGGNDGLDVRADALCSRDQKQNLQLDHDERSSKKHLSDKTDQVEVSGRGKSHSLPPSGRGQNETVTHSLHLNPGHQKENGGNSLLIDASEGDDALKASKHTKRPENQNGNQPVRSRQPTINGHRVRDADATIPARRDSSCQAATNIVKEAKDLKHSADRLKNSGLSVESTGLYFQAALKFLHGASLLESSNGESAKQGEMIRSMQMYSSTAKLCEFCAHEYEKSKDIAAAALAYKCMEVAYMRVIYYSHTNASRDRHELQTALQIVPPGESPSSSASDVDNLNNPTTLDKVPITKGVSSRHIAANHVIAAGNCPSLVRLLNFLQDVNFAMESSRKSQIAFAEEAQHREGITSIKRAQHREDIIFVKRALDFSFQDVDELLRLVRLAMEAISR
ncbi:LOW QUALITY PROTEIN: uncharacterized protein LOC114286290 [Camellia sinensis]|uniref:LOW QUALITY PROTEIN: uncharacterized protein LOC114286290 n=1 Tax=Camellia sinensis TaxID=4442 RepID=UPI0010356783|nr:LOW QUALITY PROTEIN: uncharacterized protein LOC114286290 [Camellia sinensis]